MRSMWRGWTESVCVGVFMGVCASGATAAPRDGAYVGPAGVERPPAAGTLAGPFKVTLDDAVIQALENNHDLRVQRLNPTITATFEDDERAAFDPDLTAGFSRSHAVGQQTNSTTFLPQDARDNLYSGSVGLKEFLPTGTTLSLDLTGTHDANILPPPDPLSSLRLGFTVTQSLLRGFGLGPNLARLNEARLDTRTSEYQLRGYAESFVDSVENAYWDYAVARENITIFENSLKLAEQQLSETQQRVQVGTLARTELAAAQAEVALRREALIDARSVLATAQLQLLRLTQPDGGLTRDIVLLDQPAARQADLGPVENHIENALRMRPEINQARLAVKRNELEIVRTRNGVLPRMDFFVGLGKTGYSDSFSNTPRNLAGRDYDVSAGVIAEYPILNRAAEADKRRAVLTRNQSLEAMANLRQLIEVDVRAAYIEANRTREQVTATAATRAAQEESVRAETEKFRVGRSTSILVATAQRDLLAAQTSEVQAVVNYLKAVANFYRLDGSLLLRHGIEAPGAEPAAE